MLAAILICGATVFTACSSSNDNPVIPDLNVADKIIGKWITADVNGQPALTDKKRVVTFVSATKAYYSSSRTTRPEVEATWNNKVEANVAIDGNKVTLTMQTDEQTTSVEEYIISNINDNYLTANHKVTIMVDGNVTHTAEAVLCLTKTTADYAEPILGLWECTGLTGIETYNDANARLEFLADGTYRYYRQDDNGQWQVVTNREFQDYFVDGTLLATRWKNEGDDELREWWEIDNISGDEMVWTALRENADGSTVQQEMTWKKIDLNIPENIIGKWIYADKNGEALPTNEKSVITFVSTNKAYKSASIVENSEWNTRWLDKLESDVVISGNKVTLTNHASENQTAIEEYIISDINNNEFTANKKISLWVDGIKKPGREYVIHFAKVTADYSADIVGTWEGRCISEGSVFDDGQEHRWQYNADGTYVYYVKDGNNWVPYATNTLNEYFVDGNLLCTRWIDNGVENREWWEITINGNKMNWTALRQKEDGTTFTATFEMTKVE